jgi:hypothetical protein
MVTKKSKDRPSLGSTLKKKIELPKTEKLIDDVEKRVKELHSDVKVESHVAPEIFMRTTIFLSKEMHTKIKVYCAGQEKLKIKDFITDAINEKCKKMNLL